MHVCHQILAMNTLGSKYVIYVTDVLGQQKVETSKQPCVN